MNREIQAVANERKITFKQATNSICESLERACGEDNVKCVYKKGAFKMMRRIEDKGFYVAINDALNERLAQWTA
jgi:hypothetical protein